MKILQLTRTLDRSSGGVLQAMLSFSDALTQAGHDVEIVSLDLPNSPWLDEAGIKSHALGVNRSTYGYSGRLLPWLRDEGGRFDCVIVNGIWQYHSFAAWRRYAGSRIPYYVLPQGMLDPWFKRAYPLKHLKKWLYWPWAEYRVLRDARGVIFTAEEERLNARKSFWLYRCRERIAPLGVEAPEIDLASAREDFFNSFPQTRGQRLLLFLGRLHEKKGCELLIEAYASMQPSSGSALHLVMAGPPANEAYMRLLQELAAKANVPVTFTGMLAGAQKWGAFSAAEVFILPSHQENFGIAVAEALACGTPVLISNKVNIWREIEAAGAAFVENDDLAGTKRLLERWNATSPEARLAMRENARKCFETNFEIGHATKLLLKALDIRSD